MEIVIPILMVVFLIAVPLIAAVLWTNRRDTEQMVIDKLRGIDHGTNFAGPR